MAYFLPMETIAIIAGGWSEDIYLVSSILVMFPNMSSQNLHQFADYNRTAYPPLMEGYHHSSSLLMLTSHYCLPKPLFKPPTQLYQPLPSYTKLNQPYLTSPYPPTLSHHVLRS